MRVRTAVGPSVTMVPPMVRPTQPPTPAMAWATVMAERAPTSHCGAEAANAAVATRPARTAARTRNAAAAA